jgi:hypothetical protein
VNYWAERYLATEPQLQPLQPFTSQDIDFKGGSEDVRRIAAQLGLHASFPARAQMTALAGSIAIEIGSLKSNIEVVRRIPGIPNILETPAIQTQFDGNILRVLDPISLLACKLELAATVSQENRQDVTHLEVLLPSVRAFLENLLIEVDLERLPAKEWLKVANQVLKLTTNQRARRIATQHQINWPEILPMTAIASSRNEKIRRFKEQQLE